MRKQLQELRSKMNELGIDVYIVSDKDEHLSEYTDEHFCALREFSGFSGGDGTLAVSRDNAALWTDGRYFTQAENELLNQGVELMRLGVQGTTPLVKWIAEELPEGGTLGFDGKCTSYLDGCAYIRAIGKKGKAISDKDVCGMVWSDRPEEHITECWLLDEKYCGKSARVKLAELRAVMLHMGAKAHVIATLDDIAWTLNLRADDIPCNPVFSAYMLMTADSTVLYSDGRHFNKDVRGYLIDIGVSLKENDEIFKDMCKLKGPVLIDRKRSSYELITRLTAGTHIIDRMNPSTTEKCRKNDIERQNIRIAQHKDSLAVTRFMKWFKTEALPAAEAYRARAAAGKAADCLPEITEWSCALKLHELRAADPHFIEESFETISAYGSNASMAHYMPSAENVVPIETYGLYLVDSGGQYYEGTTDVTRTWSCGEITKEERKAFTLTVIANLRLADAKFLEGCSSLVLDYAAREPFWREGMNYNHGTGHGVGHVLNVHEAPVGIRYKTATLEGAYPIFEGMYVSDEPGYYEGGRFGIRTENLLLVRKDYSNEYGNFMSFDTCTFVPVDLDCLELKLMSDEDIRLLNAYHSRVYDELQADMTEAEGAWLKEVCRPIHR